MFRFDGGNQTKGKERHCSSRKSATAGRWRSLFRMLGGNRRGGGPGGVGLNPSAKATIERVEPLWLGGDVLTFGDMCEFFVVYLV